MSRISRCAYPAHPGSSEVGDAAAMVRYGFTCSLQAKEKQLEQQVLSVPAAQL